MAPCRFSQVVFVATTCLCALPFSTALEACPKNTYRSSPIVFSCGGGFGNTYLTVPANQSVPLTIPLGVEGFRITANSSTGRVRLQLRDAASDVVVVAQDHGLINGSVRAGVYKDVGIVYSGNLSSANISLYLLGALTAPMKLSFATTASSGIARVHLAYTFERVLECSSPPAGCHEYHEEDARWQVQVWSRWARSEYQNASRAWQALAEDRAEKNGVSWPEWPEVWSVFVGNSSIQVAGEEWQPSFRYLDADRDGFVSQEEFELGFHGGGQARGRDEAAVTMEEVIGKTEGAVRSHLWIVAGAASVLLLAAVLCWRCRSSGAKRVARSVSKLSRDDVPSGPGQALKTGRAAAAASLPTKEPSASKGTRGLPDSTGAGAVHGEGLWLFPHIGQALPSFLTQESFRYVPLATQEEVPLQHAGVGHPPSSESFTGWHAQPGSFSLPASSASGLQSFAMAPEFGLGHMAPSMALGPLGQAGQDPRREAMLHAAWAARLTQGSPWTSAPASAASPSIAEPPVRHAELAGPVQVMPAEIPVVGTGAEETAADRWGDVAAVISPQRLSAEI
ncbi:unnamed protein product [Symbiodinium microadriaticum]|nr:unnamed protein product [Symbiodinium microadriaticum]